MQKVQGNYARTRLVAFSNRLADNGLVFLLGLLPVCAVFVDFFNPPLGGYADQRFILVGALVALVIVSTAFAVQKNGVWQRVWSGWPLLSFALLFALLSLPYAQEPFVWAEPGLYSFFFFAILITGSLLVERGLAQRAARVFLFVFSVVAFLYGMMTLNVYAFALNDGVTNLSQYIPWGFVNIRYWSHVATWLLPLLPAAALCLPLCRFRLWRVLVVTAAALWWWILFLSMARGSFVALMFTALAMLCLFGRRCFPWFKQLTLHALVGLALWLCLSILIPSLLSGPDEGAFREVKLNNSDRWPLFFEAWRMSVEKFPFGMGPQSWLKHEIITENYSSSPKFAHPHNMYLMWAAEYGWLLLLAFAFVCIQVLRRLLSSSYRSVANVDRHHLILISFAASMLAAFVHSGVSSVFLAPASMLVGISVLIIFWALSEPSSVSRDFGTGSLSGSFRRAFAMTMLVVIGVISAIWLTIVSDYYEAMRQDEPFYEQSVGDGLTPRFWFHGSYPRHPDLMPGSG